MRMKQILSKALQDCLETRFWNILELKPENLPVYRFIIQNPK
jgi:hypothetical protein